jgi:phasin family protein
LDATIREKYNNLIFFLEDITVNFPANPLSAATKDQTNASLHAASNIFEYVADSIVQLIQLNLSTSKASLHDSTSLMRQILDSQDPKKAYEVIQAEFQPTVTKAASYGRDVVKLGIEAQTRVTEVIHSRVTETSAQFHTLTSDLTKAAPAGTERFAKVVNASVSTWQKALESIVQSQASQLRNYVAHLDSYDDRRPSTSSPHPEKSKKAMAAEHIEA